MGTTQRPRSGSGGSRAVTYASKPDAPDAIAAGDWPAARRLALLLLGAHLLLMLAVCLLLTTSSLVASGNETTGDRAVFTAVNAGTLTGFQQTMGLREMRQAGVAGPLAMLLLTLSGSVVTLTVGGLAACRILRMPQTTWQIAATAMTGVLLASLGGAAALAASGTNLLDALLQASSAFANSGLFTGSLPTTTAPTTYLVLLPLAVLGGLGLPVLIELRNRTFGGSCLSKHSRVVLALTGLAYLIGFAALVLAQAPVAGPGGWPAWRNTLASCSVAAVNTRSCGLPFQTPAAFTAPGQWILVGLMLVGASSAGTAGGLKLTTLWNLFAGTRDVLAGRAVPRAMGIAVVWCGVYLTSLFVGVMLLLATDSQIPGERLIFLVASALGNVGLWHDPVSITGPGLFVLSLLMLIGRLAPLGILWWMAETTRGAEVLVG